MKVINGTESFCDPGTPVAVTLGFFDGVHLGHQKLLKTLVHVARDIHGVPVVLTFDSHPFRVVCPHRLPPMITTLTERMKYIEEIGVKYCVVQPFDKTFAEMPAHDFLEKILVKRLHARAIIGGYDTRFGKKREGCTEFLRAHAEQYKYELHEVEPFYLEDKVVSSTSIRNAIMAGDLACAEKCLTRPWGLWAHVTHGHGIGSTLGYPTANLDTQYIVMPPNGVYAARVLVKNKWYHSLMYVGTRPTFTDDGNERVCEVYISGFSGDLYDAWVRVQPLQYMRDDIKFNTTDELRAQIAEDEKRAAVIFHSKAAINADKALKQ